MVTLYMDTPRGILLISVNFDIASAEIPRLLGLDVLDREGLTPDISYNLPPKLVRIEDAIGGKTVYLEDCSLPR